MNITINHKNLFQRIVAFVFVVAFVYSCVQDDFQNSSVNEQQNEKTYIIKSVSLNEIENKEIVEQKINSIFYKEKSSLNYQMHSKDGQNDYVLNTDYIL